MNDPETYLERYRLTHDMAAVEDFQKMSDRLHDLMMDHDPNKVGSGLSSSRVRVTLELPPEWLMLAMWIRLRRRDREFGLDRALSHAVPEKLDRHATPSAKRELWSLLYEWYHHELHWLAAGGHPLLEATAVESCAFRQTCEGRIG